jgi:subtilisin family serine protease
MGRYVVVLADGVHGDEKAMSAALRSLAGVSTLTSVRDFADGAVNMEQARDADALLLPTLGLALMSAEPDQMASLAAAASEDEQIEAIEPEQTHHVLTQPEVLAAEYLRGYRDAAAELYEHAHDRNGTATAEEPAQFVDTPAFTWGLQATRVQTSHSSGRGVPVAILDTGFDLRHPDFAGRPITSKSFVPNQTPQDGSGHGTHLTGTSSGPLRPANGSRRYGIAYQDNIFIGKVFGDQDTGNDGQILTGMDWAVAHHCRAVLFAGGSNIRQISPVYEAVGRRALAAGSLIIAAAGGNADRAHGAVGFVGAPANSPSIMAVGAVDSPLHIANFSPRSNPAGGGEIDLVGPGVEVYSSWPSPTRYRILSGTSMAAAHVAGIAALLAQATGATGTALWGQLVRATQRLPIPSVDVGAGLIQAPQ